jgi:hypothetical protein
MVAIEVFTFLAKRQLAKQEGLSRTAYLADSDGNSILPLSNESWQKDLREVLNYLREKGWKIISVFPSGLEKDMPIAPNTRVSEITIVAEKIV